LWAAGLGAAAQFGKISVIYGPLGAVYPPASVPFLVSLVGFTGIVFGTTAGVIVGRLGFRRVILGALLLGAGLSAAQAALLPLPWMVATRLAEGVAHLSVVVAAPVLIAQVAAPRDQGLAMTLWASFFGVSFALTAWGGLPLVAACGPGALFGAHAAWLLGCAAVLARLLPRGLVARAPTRLTLAGVLAEHRAIYASPSIAAPALGFLFYTLVFIAVLTLVPDLAPPDWRGVLAGGMPLVATAASLSFGVLALRVMRPVALVSAGLGGGAVAVVAMAALAGVPAGFVAASLGLAAALGLAQGASFAAIPDLVAAPDDRARAAGALAQLGNVGTTSGTPVLAAMIAAGGTGGLVAFVAPLCLGGIAMHWWLARRRARGAG